MPRLFTRDEANALLPTLIPLVTRIQALAGEVEVRQQALQALREQVKMNGHGAMADRLAVELERLVVELNGLAEQITDVGCEMKDLTLGLLDFPSQRQGKVVYLCWRLGEPAVDYWHDLTTGFGSRQPL